MAGRADLVRELLEQGAALEAPLKKKLTCARWANARGHVRLGRLLEELSGEEGRTSPPPGLERLHERLASIK
jgi:ankyrin repeat protein